jgi:2-(1,2-epoxy-1,2-dihydrophenyl)acetyl-CoA isomerase
MAAQSKNGVRFEVDGSIATITLDRPAVGNALDIPMCRELMELAIRCEGDAAIRCVVLTGEGKLFCGGGDVAAFSGAGDLLPEFLREITSYVNAAISVFVRMPKPLVVAVNGSAAGAGIGLAIVGDIVLADPAASFSLAYTGIGLTPDGGTTWLLPRLIGLRRTQELCLTNRKVKAEEAASLGLVTRVVEAGALAQETAALAQQFAKAATTALGSTRRLLAESYSNTLETQLALEGQSISAQARKGGEGREGVAAFIEKRAPQFTKED